MFKNEKRRAAENDSVLEQLDALKREDEKLYNILAVDIWALAQTMDEFQPGFWAAFMKNRDRALKRFINNVMKSKPVEVKRPPYLH